MKTVRERSSQRGKICQPTSNTLPIFKRYDRKQDGRDLFIYGTKCHNLPWQKELPPLSDKPQSHLRWHPLRQEWVCYAVHRQNRTFKPPAAYCPFCPTRTDILPTEIPYRDFEVAVFENRFSAFAAQAKTIPQLSIDSAPAIGRCEIIVYSSVHEGSLGTLPLKHLELIVRVWRDRYQDLMARESIQFVMPFENRGEEVGVTLHHPHGQIYAFSYIPPVVAKMQQAFREKPILQELRQTMGREYYLFNDDRVLAFVPPFQRYPYEVWLTTHQFHPGLWTFSEAEITSLANTLSQVVRLYDRLFDRPFPYIMLLYAAPKGEESYFQFHIQFLPCLRTADKLKYLAGCETGAGTFLADLLPEETAARLRQLRDEEKL
ncbi:MAG: galactose-1-phosphate uridylyltransferase [Prochloraceae cyanobacterium]|nr:galactose-1-phosphate uridylyltransferase [Prochloraceae cyanobacterium]